MYHWRTTQENEIHVEVLKLKSKKLLFIFTFQVPNAIGIATSWSQILLYMIYKNKSPLSNLIGSIQATNQEAIEMRSTDVAKMENPSLSKGNHNPKSSSRPTSLLLMRTPSRSPHETHHDFPTEQDEGDRISVIVDHPWYQIQNCQTELNSVKESVLTFQGLKVKIKYVALLLNYYKGKKSRRTLWNWIFFKDLQWIPFRFWRVRIQ